MKPIDGATCLLLAAAIVAACGGAEGLIERRAESRDAVCVEGPQCPHDAVIPDPGAPPLPDLRAEIVSGAGCPLSNGQTLAVRVRNAGAAPAGKSVLRVRRHYQWSAVQVYDASSYFLIPALAAGASATSGVYLGDGVNGVFVSRAHPAGGDGATFPVTSTIAFENAPWATNPSSQLLYWELVADASLPKSGFNWRDARGIVHDAQVSYSSMVAEQDEGNNHLGGNGFCP